MFLQQLINGVVLGSIYALIALGYTMVYGILFFINFAHGDILMFGAFVSLWLAASTKVHIVFVLLGGMIGAALMGITVERLAYRPIRRGSRLSAILSALGVSIFLENLFIRLQGPRWRPFPEDIFPDKIFHIGNVQITLFQLTILGATVVLMLALTWFINKTKTGKAIRATSENAHAASLMGVNINRTIAIVFFIGSLLAGAAGVFIGGYFNTVYPMMGWMPGIKAFVAAVLGGIGNLPGAVLGAMVLGISEVMTVGFISSSYRDAIAFGILIIILLIRPQGLLGSKETNKL